MPKEYEDIKKQYSKKNPDWDDKKVSEVASKVFYSIFDITVNDAIKLESEGKWRDYLEKHSTREAKSYSCKSQFINSDFVIVDDGKDLYVDGFVSSEKPDNFLDAVPQEQVVAKINDKKNRLSKMASEDHSWMKGDVKDYKPVGYAQTPFELKYNAKSGTYDAFGRIKLDKTADNFEVVYNKLQNRKYKGFSIEYQLFNKVKETIGDVEVNKWTDFDIIGIGFAEEPINESAWLNTFYAKSYNIIGGKSMDENNTEPQVVVSKEGDSNAQVLNTNNNTSNNSSVDNDTQKKYISKLEEEISSIKQENEKIKNEKELKELELKKKDLEKELSGLTAGKTVLIDNTKPESVKSQEVPAQQDIVKQKLGDIYSNNKITTREKIKQVSEIVFK